MNLKQLMWAKALSGGGSAEVNLFDISTLEGKSGITIDGDEFKGTAAKINAAGTLALASPIAQGKTVTVSCTLRNEGNSSTEGNGLSVFLVYSDETTERMFYGENADTTAKAFTNTFTAAKEITGISFSYYAKGQNIWHISGLKVVAKG